MDQMNVSKARSLGETKAAKLLDENLRQEKEALKKVETISKSLLEDAKPSTGTRSTTSRRRSTTSARRKSPPRGRAAASRRTSR